MNEPVLSATAGYAENAAALIEQYERLTFEEVHREVLSLFPVRPGRVLDIGAGTGRDAAALAARGHMVTAVEPTRELREHGQRIHLSPAIRWIDDLLPNLLRLRDQGCFDLILLTAVWMHLDADEQRIAMKRIADLIAPDGLVVMSLRHGPVPAGRRMFAVSADEVETLASEHGLVPIRRREREDILGRGDVRWTFLALRALKERSSAGAVIPRSS
jgi:SAM-dependent methyltransferase